MTTILVILLLPFFVLTNDARFLRAPAKPIQSITTPLYRATIVKAYPHDVNSFTEGFGFISREMLGQTTNPVIYESSGLKESHPSLLQLKDYRTNKILYSRHFQSGFFAEGATIINNQILLATLSSNKLYRFDPLTLQPLDTGERNAIRLPSTMEHLILHVWGLTSDPTNNFLYISEGTSVIHVVLMSSEKSDNDSFTLQYIDQIHVHDGDTTIRNINELEFIEGLLYANILGQSCIAKILPETGDVVGWISFGKELQEEYPEIGQSRSLLKQMNGIAYDTLSKVLLVTGKNWPYTFEIREGLPIGNDDRTMKTEVAACYPATIRKLDFNHVQLGLNNQLPFIPMPTNQEVREHFHG